MIVSNNLVTSLTLLVLADYCNCYVHQIQIDCSIDYLFDPIYCHSQVI